MMRDRQTNGTRQRATACVHAVLGTSPWTTQRHCQPVHAAQQRTSRRPPLRTAFTLVELLVVISIITLLASMVLVALAGVQETARADRTRAQIARIEALMSAKWESYRGRRMPLPPAVKRLAQARRFSTNTNIGAMQFQQSRDAKLKLDVARVDMLRELQRMELPDRRSDVLFEPVVLPSTQVPSVWNAYLNMAVKLISARRGVAFTGTNPQKRQQLWGAQGNGPWTDEFESAECLYLILSQMVDQQTKALEFFPPQEISDLDNDGMPEILDGWGRPVMFLRWAPGLQIAGSPQDGKSPDPVDLLGIYPRLHNARTFALYPLIISSGPDRQMDMIFDNPDGADIVYAHSQPPNNPFLGLPGVTYQPGNNYLDQTSAMVGTPADRNGDGVPNWLDNITNHNLTGS
jgi:prepilin-type N-terminal cleavage/methylation domain-containing protein